MSEGGQPGEGKSRLVAASAAGGGEWGITANRHRTSFWGHENSLEWTVLIVALLYEYTKKS